MTIYNSSDFGLGPKLGAGREPLERFQGFLIFHGDDGYYWNGAHGAESDDFFETLQECRQDICDWNNAAEDDDIGDGDHIQFADPGGNSALRAASESNPRNLPCPSCGRANRLTPADRACGYQCDSCADKAERGLAWDD